MKEQLHQAGLTENESKLYLTLLELGPSNAGAISRKSGLHRRVVYDTIEMLIQKGLIGYIRQNNIRLFHASNPQRILELIKERERHINEVMPRMMDLFSNTREKQETDFYKGKEGLKTVFHDQLEDNKSEILILGASSKAEELLPFYFKWYDQDRLKKKIKVRIISYEKFDYKVPLSEIRLLPQKYANPMAVNIYKDKVAIILWKKDPLSVVIKNKEIADSYRKYFELLWKQARK